MTAIGEPGVSLAAGGELTGNVYPSASPGRSMFFISPMTSAASALTPNTAAGAKAFRCVVDPLN